MTVIEELEYTEKDGRKYYKITANGTYRAFSGTIAFAQLKDGGFKKGDNVNLKYTEIDGKATDGTPIKHKNLDRIELLESGTGNEASPSPKTKSTSFANEKTSIYDKGDMSAEEYRAYQIKMMNECWNDAVTLLNNNKHGEEPTFDIAVAFFEKRCSPRIYAKKEESK